jgi:hypothetical protein
VHLFEMWGRLYVAVHVIGQHLLHFWVMPPWTKDGMLHCSWELCYTFYVDDDDIRKSHLRKRSPWHDARDGMLCYRLGDCLYKYNTTKDDQRKKKKQAGGFSEWDHRIQLPVAPLPTKQRCNFYGGYRPSLLSPHHLTFIREDKEQDQFEHGLIHALRCKQLFERCSTCPPNRSDHPILGVKRDHVMDPPIASTPQAQKKQELEILKSRSADQRDQL